MQRFRFSSVGGPFPGRYISLQHSPNVYIENPTHDEPTSAGQLARHIIDYLPAGPAPIPTNISNFAISRFNMASGSLDTATPYNEIYMLPLFFVGVPITKDINNTAYPCSFDGGGIHAYGFRNTGYPSREPDT